MLQEKIFHFSGDLCTFILLYFSGKIKKKDCFLKILVIFVTDKYKKQMRNFSLYFGFYFFFYFFTEWTGILI